MFYHVEVTQTIDLEPRHFGPGLRKVLFDKLVEKVSTGQGMRHPGIDDGMHACAIDFLSVFQNSLSLVVLLSKPIIHSWDSSPEVADYVPVLSQLACSRITHACRKSHHHVCNSSSSSSVVAQVGRPFSRRHAVPPPTTCHAA